MFDVCLIGHVVRDLNSIGGAELPPRPGGAAYYSTMVYRRLGLRTAVLDPVEGPSDDSTHGSSDDDYVSLMRDNLRAVQEANDCS